VQLPKASTLALGPMLDIGLWVKIEVQYPWMVDTLTKTKKKSGQLDLALFDPYPSYPLVNCHITIEHHHFQFVKSTINGHFQ